VIARDAKRLYEEGKSVKEIRELIEENYGHIGPGTDTPMLPD